MKTCIACGSHLLEDFYNPGTQPLAALNLPRSQEDAIGSLRYPMNFQVCLACGHIFNVDFDVAMIPYEEDSNLMFNNGAGWAVHMGDVATRLLADFDIEKKTIIDIGAGDGMFLEVIQAADKLNRCIAFEPGVESRSCEAAGIETVVDYFVPKRDFAKYKPDVLVCRHVFEHLERPREFAAELAYYGQDCRPLFLVEVPCIQKALGQGRFGDYLYEHVSNFTLPSLVNMLETAGWFTMDVHTAYNDEVVVWVGRPDRYAFETPPRQPDSKTVRELLDFLLDSQKSTAFWGATGKGAAFLNACDVPSWYRVVDSDHRKAGRYVPGTGQLIEAPSNLWVDPVETVIITTRWRAADIYSEILRDHPSIKEVLIVDGDVIREYAKDDYDKEKAQESQAE
jgi:hypothetical protein